MKKTMAARVTTIVNQKGGVGKTTTALALASGLKLRGFKVLMLDADPQANMTFATGADTDGGLFEAMKNPQETRITETPLGDLIGGDIALASADITFTQTGREYRIREILEPIRKSYDHIIIDSPPSIGIMTINALTASDDVIVPVGADIFSLQGLKQLLDTVGMVQKYSNRGLKVAGILITRKGNRATATRELINAIQRTAGDLDLRVYDTIIREGVAVREAQIMRRSLFETSSKVADDYQNFIDEYLKEGNENA